jgi:hypothetical protein
LIITKQKESNCSAYHDSSDEFRASSTEEVVAWSSHCLFEVNANPRKVDCVESGEVKKKIVVVDELSIIYTHDDHI